MISVLEKFSGAGGACSQPPSVRPSKIGVIAAIFARVAGDRGAAIFAGSETTRAVGPATAAAFFAGWARTRAPIARTTVKAKSNFMFENSWAEESPILAPTRHWVSSLTRANITRSQEALPKRSRAWHNR